MQAESPGRLVRPAKSRGGCSQCRSRRVKCDERKPGCLRCERNGITCSGYQWNIRFSKKHEVYMQPPKTPTRAQADTARSRRDQTVQVRSPRVQTTQTVQTATALAITNNELTAGSFAETVHPFWVAMEETITPSQPLCAEAAISPPILFDECLSVPVESVPTDILSKPDADDEWISWALQGVVTEADDSDILNSTPFGLAESGFTLRDQSVSRRSSALPRTPESRGTPPEAPISAALTDTRSALCEYFLEHVIGLYCVWDGPQNYMRTISAHTWQSSAPMYHTMQSMAAACLADDFPHLRQLARDERVTAFNALCGQSPGYSDIPARSIALLLLAQTSHWHCPDELGIEQFRSVQRTLGEWQREAQDKKSLEFVTGCMGYWEMVLSFITDGDNLSPKSNEVSTTAASCEVPPHPCQPHEFSGVSSFMVQILSEVGNLIFNFRVRCSGVPVMSEQTARYFLDSLAKARRLERKLLDHRAQDPANILDTGDLTTSVSDFCHLDEAYRCTGLLQLYRIFPDLLASRYHPWSGRDELLRPSHEDASRRPTQVEMRRWLTDLALHILSYLRKIPFESRTLCAQPWLLVAVATELRYTTPSCEGQLDRFAVEIAQARRFISGRIQAYMQILPLRKVKNVLDLVQVIWSELDNGKLDTYWVDVASKRHLTTIMG